MPNQQFNRADMSRHAAAKAFQNSDSHVAAAMLIDVEYAGVFAELERLRKENAELQQQVERLTEDAERYRWVKENAGRSHSLHMDNTRCYELRRLLNGRHRSLDDAIDAARAR